MPALVTCEGNLLEKQWNAGSDDFVAPAFMSIVLSLLWYVPAVVKPIIVSRCSVVHDTCRLGRRFHFLAQMQKRRF